jgi:CheY-like chemotaxis protein
MGRIIVCDDEADMRMALRLFLERGGHTVEEAENGEMALEKIAANPFDLAMLDMRMPGLDGVQTLARLRQSHPKLPVLMVTGYGSVDNTAEVMALGANGLISKPFQHQDLRDAMAKAGVGWAAESTAVMGDLPSFKMPRWLLGVFGGLLLLAGVAYQFGLFTNRDFKLAYSNPVDMTWKDNKLWVGDWFTQSIYLHDITKTGAPIVKTYYLPDVHVTGIAVAGDRLFTSDSWAHKLRRHKFDEYLTPEKVIDSPGPSPTSLFFDGKYLWSIDSKLAKIYQHQLDDKLTVIAEYKAPGTAPVGFFKDDQFAWISDAQTRLLYKLRLDDKLTVLGAYTVDDLEARGEPLSCFRWVDGDLWFARDRLNVMYRRAARWLKPKSK